MFPFNIATVRDRLILLWSYFRLSDPIHQFNCDIAVIVKLSGRSYLNQYIVDEVHL